jgi:hypothetical protein
MLPIVLSFLPCPFALLFKFYSLISESSFLVSFSCCSPFFWNVTFVTELSLLHIILFGMGKISNIGNGTTQKMERVNREGKWAKRETGWEGKW